jgi:protein-disulfide isomerase
MKLIFSTLLFLLASTTAVAQSAVPSKDQVDAAMRRTFGYDPAVFWEIVAIKPSPIAGLAEVVVSMNKQQPVHLYVSADARQAIVGESIPFGVDPFSANRTMLTKAKGPTRGGEAMTVVVFGNLDCLGCKATQPLLDQLATDFPQVRQVFEILPLAGGNSKPGGRAALWADCVGRTSPAKFWPFVDHALTFPDGINLDKAETGLGAASGELGLDPQALSQCASSSAASADLDASQMLAQRLGVDDLPTLFVNGRRVPRPERLPADQLKRLVQFELDHSGR